MPYHLLNVRIDSLNQTQALCQVGEWLQSNGQHVIFTPNPEMLVASTKRPFFREVLNRNDLNLCDAKGIQLFAPKGSPRVPGIDFFLQMCNLAEKGGYTISLVGAGDNARILQAHNHLKKLFPLLNIVSVHPGPAIILQKPSEKSDILIQEHGQKSLIEHITKSAPQILFVGFGQIKQEEWIEISLSKLPSVKIAMGVGGVFDILSGRFTRAPRLFRQFGLEWLWRLFQEPRRIHRIWTAVAVFPWLIFFHRFKK